MRTKLIATLAGLSILAVGLGGCGGSSHTSSTAASGSATGTGLATIDTRPPVSAPSETPQQAYTALFHALMTGDGTVACDGMTPESQALAVANYVKQYGGTGITCQFVIRAAQPIVDAFIAPNAALRFSKVHTSPTAAALTVDVQTKLGWGTPTSLKFTVSGGKWLLSGNPSGDLSTQSGSGSSTTESSTSGPASGPSRATVLAWPAKWCQTQYNMTRRQIEQIMGPPTQDLPGAQFGSQAQWRAYQYDFTAYFTQRAQTPNPLDEHARQLEADPAGNLSAQDKATIPCALTRGAPGETFPGAP